MRAISVTRRRWIAGGLAEHVEVTNYSSTAQHIELELDLDADAADIFEVRGRVRRASRPVPPDRVHAGVARLRLRGARRPPAADARVVHARRGQRRGSGHGRRLRRLGASRLGARCRARRAGERALGGVHRPDADPRPRQALGRDAGPPRPVRRRWRVPAARPRRGRRRRRQHRRADGRRGGVRPAGRSGARASARTASCSTSRSAGASPTCACSGTTARCAASTTSRPVSRGSRRCSGATASSPRSRSCRSCLTSRGRRSGSSPTGRRPRTIPAGTWSRARSSMSCGSASWRGPGNSPTGRTTAPSTRRPCG